MKGAERISDAQSLLGPHDDSGDAIRLDAALLHSVIETAPDAIVVIDAQGRIGGFSPAAERMLGYSADEVIGRNVSVLMPEPYRARHDDYLERYLATGEKRIIGTGRTVTARHKSGRTIPIELAVGEVKSGDSHVFTGFIRDISERVDVQARTATLQRELAHVSRLSAMGEVTSMIVHELNQPLAAIANYGEAARRLQDNDPGSPRVAEFIEKSVQQAHRASDMIRGLRRFISRDSSEREPICLNEVVREAAKLALIGTAQQQVQASFDLAEDLPQVVADRIAVQQVVVNLIRNGIDAMLDAHVAEPRIGVATATATRGGGEVVVSITDAGPGVPEALGKDVFEPFVTRKAGGMGLGLSISRSIVDAHGGQIWFARGEAGGTVFSFSLPLGKART